jgi:hypothetical protein
MARGVFPPFRLKVLAACKKIFVIEITLSVADGKHRRHFFFISEAPTYAGGTAVGSEESLAYAKYQ